jgi:Flp pilus assembly protein TadG
MHKRIIQLRRSPAGTNLAARTYRGAAMVEMAIVLVLLLSLLFGVIEFGWILFKMGQINQAARHGARIAVRPAADEDEVAAAVDVIMNSSSLGRARTDYRLTISPSTSVEVGEPVQVYVELDYSTIKLIGFVPTPSVLHGRATMSKEGP